MSMRSSFTLRTTAFWVAVFTGGLSAQMAQAHTSSVGYENAGPGSVTFWYGTYHSGTSYTEGSLKVTGPDSYSSTVTFSLLVNSKPSGLVDGSTNFYSDGSKLIATYGGTIYAWQGSTFTGLKPGTYTFTYVPISTPTSVWDPIDAIILSSTVVLDASIIGSTEPEPEPEPASRFIDNADIHSSPAARVLDDLNGTATGGMNAAISVLESLNATEQASALQRVAPDAGQAAAVAATRSLAGAMDTVQLRLDGVRTVGYRTAWDETQKNGKVLVATIGDLGALFSERRTHGLWTKAFGSRGDQELNDGFAGYDTRTVGASVGADTLLPGDWIAGGAISYASTDVDMGDHRSGDHTDISSYQVTGYGSRSFDSWYIETMAAYARHNYDSSRSTGVAGIANAQYSADQWAARIGAGYPFEFNNGLTFTPIASIEGTHLNQNGYTESGAGALSLRVEEQTANRVRSALGARIDTTLALRSGATVKPSVHAFWRHDFRNDGVDTTATFTGGGATFVTAGQDITANTYNVGAAVTVQRSETFSLSVQLDGEWAADYQGASGQIVGQWRF